MAIRINRVYTRSGDKGQTALVGGKRVSKTHPRVSSYGDVDELNTVLGICKEELDTNTAELREVIEYLQQELFDLGSELATDTGDSYEGMWTVKDEHVSTLEKLCDHYQEGLPELTSFILPGGSKLAGYFHLARTVARRAERSMLALRESEAEDAISDAAVAYINRINDLFFVLARWTLMKQGKDAPLWDKDRKRNLPV